MNQPAVQLWRYEPDENPKRKHRWNKNEAGFEAHDGKLVGKCPSGISAADAERLLNEQSVPYFNPRAPGPRPDRLYVVHDGVVYRATPTQAGVSFHAFPELPERFLRLPRSVRRAVVELAERLGCKEEVERWISG